MASDCPVERKGSSPNLLTRQRERGSEGGEGRPPRVPPQRTFWLEGSQEPRKEDSLWHPRVPSELTWAFGSGENSWWMEVG